MFINFMVKLLSHFRLMHAVFLILNTIFVFNAQAENVDKNEQQLEENLIKSRVRRAPKKKEKIDFLMHNVKRFRRD